MDINFLRLPSLSWRRRRSLLVSLLNPSLYHRCEGNIVEDHSQKSIKPAAFSPMSMMIPPSEKRGDWFNMSANYSNLQGVGADYVYESMLPPLKPQPVIVAVLDSGVDIGMRI